MNALAKVQNKFLKIDIDKWSRVTPSEQVITSHTLANIYLGY